MDTKKNGWLTVIGGFKLFNGALLTLLALGAFHLLHKDVGDALEHGLRAIRFDPENRHLAGLLAKANLVDDHKLKELGWLTLVYAALFLTEGVGLLLRKRWAEYLTVIATASLIPLEIYEVCKHGTAVKVGLLLANVAIVLYLIVNLRKTAKEN